jgi:hypothetical protein
MKHHIRAIPIIYAAAFCAAVLAAPSARANSISGSIAFSSLGVTVNNTDLANATSFDVVNPYVANNPQGTYSLVPALTAIAFNGFTFNPPVAFVDPLWTFTLGPASNPTVYSFDATSVAADWNPIIREWDIGGTGIAMISGYTPTVGTWTVNLSQTGASFAFDATSGAQAAVPDGGSSVVLSGGTFLGLGAFGRKFRR